MKVTYPPFVNLLKGNVKLQFFKILNRHCSKTVEKYFTAKLQVYMFIKIRSSKRVAKQVFCLCRGGYFLLPNRE